MIGTGFLLGMVSSLSGVGGSLIAIPLLYTQLHFPLRKAFGTSSAAIVALREGGEEVRVMDGTRSPAEVHADIVRLAAAVLSPRYPGVSLEAI